MNTCQICARLLWRHNIYQSSHSSPNVVWHERHALKWLKMSCHMTCRRHFHPSLAILGNIAISFRHISMSLGNIAKYCQVTRKYKFWLSGELAAHIVDNIALWFALHQSLLGCHDYRCRQQLCLWLCLQLPFKHLQLLFKLEGVIRIYDEMIWLID